MICDAQPVTKLEFILVPYGDNGFLLNKNHVIASLYGGSVSLVRENDRDYMEYYGERVPVVDLDPYFERHFCLSRSGNVHLILMLKVAGDRRVGVKLSGIARLTSVSLNRLKLLPPSLRKLEKKHGILAVYFDGDGKLYYFIDLNQVIVETIDVGEGCIHR